MPISIHNCHSIQCLLGKDISKEGWGDGVTTVNSTKWSDFNSSYPFVSCGITNALGNKTGVVSFNLPA